MGMLAFDDERKLEDVLAWFCVNISSNLNGD